MISLAAYCILKMTRSRLRWHIDIEAGEEAIFTAIRFTRKASLQNNDLDAKNGNILAQLWGSERAFRKSEGEEQDGLWLMLRSRLVSRSNTSHCSSVPHPHLFGAQAPALSILAGIFPLLAVFAFSTHASVCSAPYRCMIFSLGAYQPLVWRSAHTLSQMDADMLFSTVNERGLRLFLVVAGRVRGFVKSIHSHCRTSSISERARRWICPNNQWPRSVYGPKR